MKPLALNLSKVKKVSGDKDSTTFQHPDGHQIKILHSGVSALQRKQMDKMPVQDVEAAESKHAVSDFRSIKNAQALYEDPASNPRGYADGDVVEAPVADQAPSDDADRAPAASPAPVAKSDPYGMEANAQAQINALNEQKQAQQALAASQGAIGAASVPVEQAYQKTQQKIMDDYRNNYAALNDDRKALQDDILSGHVNVDRYIHGDPNDPDHPGMTTGRKVLSGIGLILGGAGAHSTGGQNLAFNYLQSQINQDIEAQKNDLGQKQNLLSHNLAATQDLGRAAELTRLQSNDLVSSKLKALADQQANPVAKANALNIAGQFDAKSAEIQHNLAVSKALLGGGQEPEQAFQNRMQWLRMNGQEAMAKDIEAKHLPGASGQASVPLTPENRSALTHFNNLDALYGKAQDYLNKVGKMGAGFQNATKAEGKSIEDAMRLEMGQLVGLNRFTHEEGVSYGERTPDLTGTHFTGQDQAKLSELRQELQNRKAAEFQGLGIRGQGMYKAPIVHSGEIKRQTKDGKTAIFDSNKKFLRYQ